MSTPSSATVWEWRPPRHPNRARNRTRLRLGFGVFALLVAVGAAVSSWSDGFVAVAASMFVPVLILLVGFAIDRVYDAGNNFVIQADGASLSVRRGRGAPTVIPVGDLVDLRVARQSHTGPNGTVSSSFHLVADRRSGPALDVILPTFLGSSFTNDDAPALEAELRRRCRLA